MAVKYSERQPNFAALNRGRHLCSAGRPSRWALAHISSLVLECGPLPNVMAALPNIGGAVCSTPQSLADAHYTRVPCSNATKTRNPLKFAGVPQTRQQISAVSLRSLKTTTTVINKLGHLLYSIRPNYILSPLYYGSIQERHTFSNSSVFHSQSGNDGVGLHACISA